MDVTRLSELPEASPLDNAALLPVVQGGGKRTTVGALRDRAGHTGSQPIASVTGLQVTLDGKSALGHGHQIGETQGLQAALDGKAAASHSHDANALTSGTVDIARLPVAASGVGSSTQLVRADDSRLSGGGAGIGVKNAVINGCCRVTHRVSKSLSGGWQYAQVDLLAVRADGSATAGTLKQATGVTALTSSGYACLVQGATLNSSGAVWWRHRIEARDALRLRSAAAVVSARTYHDVGTAVSYTVTVNKPNAADDFSAVTQIATGTVSVANAANADLTLAVADLGDCSNGLEVLIKAACGVVSNKWFYLGDLQLEPGTAKTAFERRPMALETHLVARFLRACTGLVGKANSGTNIQIPLSHPDLRAVPGYEATAALAFTDAVTADFTQSQASITTIHDRTADNGRVSCGFFSGLTSGTVLIQRGAGGTILASAEF
ncbi:putative phage tail fiber repeat family protein [uncultured Gammaproteobacteria bacterium]